MYHNCTSKKFYSLVPLERGRLALLFMEIDKYHLMFLCTLWNKRHVETRNKRNLFKIHYVNLHVELDVFEDIYNKWLQIRKAWEES
jgi:hypothetical protein